MLEGMHIWPFLLPATSAALLLSLPCCFSGVPRQKSFERGQQTLGQPSSRPYRTGLLAKDHYAESKTVLKKTALILKWPSRLGREGHRDNDVQ